MGLLRILGAQLSRRRRDKVFEPDGVISWAETRVVRGVLDATMVPDDSTEADAPTCKKCGQTLALIGSVPALDGRPRTRIYKCSPCQMVIRIPPMDIGQP